MMSPCDCSDCEQKLQQYVDRELTAVELVEVEEHLTSCNYCRRCYRFERTFRMVVKRVLAEPMSPELKQRLLDLRTPLL
jgi:anti-sigma factor (TIGR02949 family)